MSVGFFRVRQRKESVSIFRVTQRKESVVRKRKS